MLNSVRLYSIKYTDEAKSLTSRNLDLICIELLKQLLNLFAPILNPFAWNGENKAYFQNVDVLTKINVAISPFKHLQHLRFNRKMKIS